MKIPKMVLFDYGQTLIAEQKFDGVNGTAAKGSLNAGLFPVWYIGAIDLPYTEDKNILTVKAWSEIARYMDLPDPQRRLPWKRT